jgi:hypothetical protein
MRDDEQQATDPWAAWRGRIVASRRRRDDNIGDWQDNVNRRKSTRSRRVTAADSTATTTDPVDGSVNKDWPLTKAKTALLYSQTPEIRLSTENPQAASIIPGYAKSLNATIEQAAVGAAIEEELADVINASGIAGVIIACEKRTETRDVPTMDPMVAGMSGMTDIPTAPMTTITDIRYPVRRISPASLLIPSDFTGSIYDQARWLGYEDGMPWAVAQAEFGLSDDQKDAVLGVDRRTQSSNSLNTDTTTYRDTQVVNYTEIFYWRHYYDPEETSFAALQRLVFVDGLEEPVINEPYTGQQRQPDGSIVGVTRNPIQILTLTYISDDALPPSDSTISRAQINQLERSREQMELQRRHAIPIRWGDTNRISANTRARLEKGDYQSFIWTNGPGERAIGEVARAAFPQEKYELDAVIDREITDQWTVGPNQSGSFNSGERSAREAGIVQQNFQTRIGQERAKVERHFIAIAEVLGGLMALHGATPIPPALLGSITYGIHADSTVLLDADAQIDRLMKGLNLTAQSGFVNPKPIITKIWELLGEDPTQIVIDPQPKPPEPVKVSVSKAEDLVNPIMLATMLHTQQGPGPDDLSAAIKLLQMAMAGGVPVLPQQQPENGPPRDPETPGIANSGWDTAPRVERRAEDGGA